MKKILFLSVILLMCVSAMQAIPAHPGTAKVRQPDGSYVTLRLLGDEWMRFNTTVDGYSVVKNQRGYYVYAEQKEGRLLPTTRVAHDMAERSAGEQAFLQGVRKYQKPLMADAAAAMKVRMETDGAQRRAQGRRATDYSNFKGLIILVQFDDKDFSRADYPSILKDMVNKPGYSGYDDVKMPGSVLDYFSDNSGGKFRPQFDIVGPYHVNYSQYDCNLKDGKCDDILIAALDSADADVNFKNYDGNGDGMVDLVYFVVAGLGSNCTGNNDNLWWPHRAQIWDDAARAKGGSPYVYKDGVLLWDYASSTELTGFEVKPTTIIIDGIGSICHEFSHVLGLPDFYDTNYEEGGLSNTIGEWSVMDQGCYLNDGYSPAGYSLYERYSVGFIDEPAKIEREGSYILNPLSASYTGLRIDSQEKDEFFLLENRQRDLFKWDAWLPASGMLVYRVDRSNKEVWTRNTVNAVPDHNYYQLVRAGGTGKGAAFDVFPGKGSVTVLNNTTEPANLLSWSGKATKWGLSDIRQSQGVISFTVHDAITLTGITLPDSLEVPLGVHAQLEALLTPDGAEAVLQWSSSNQNVATVNQQGLVKGIAAGTCTITVTSDNGVSARCQVTVQSLPVVSVDELKHKELDTKVLLQLTGAEVLYAYEDMTFLRDASGCILISGANLGLKRNDRVTGTVCGQVAEMNNMMQLTSAGVATNADNLTVSEGPAVQPRTVHPADLTEADYADYVLVKAVQLERDNGVWAVIGNRRIRLNNYFQIQGINLPMSIKGKYYDVEAIYGTNVLDDQVIDELYRTAKVVEVDPPTEQVADNEMVYNLGEGYYNYGTGLSRDETYDVALRIKDPALVGCRVKAVRIWFDAIDGLSDAKAWLSREIGVKSLKFPGADVQTVAFDVQQGSNDVAFSPYTITEDGVFVGYTVTAAKDVAKEPVRLTGSTTAEGMYIHTSGLYRASFHSMYGEQGDLAIEVLLEGNFCQNAAAATMVTADYMLTSERGEAVVHFANYGKRGVASFDYTVSIAGISQSHHVQLPTPVPAVYGRQWQTTVEVPAPKVQGIHPTEVTVTQVNGAPNEWAAPSASGAMRCYEKIPTHRAVLEEYTGTWCGYCPRGFVGLEEMNRLHPADFVGISYHNKDPMEVIATSDYPWNTDVLGSWPGFPAAVLDRHLITDAFYGGQGLGHFGIEDSWLRVCKVLAPADVDVNTRWADDHTLEAEAVVTFPFSTDDVHYALQFVLTSDGLSGTTGEWNQTNYYKGNTSLPPSMDIFTKGDNDVSGLVFNDVFVDWSGRLPIANSLPAQVIGETPYSYKYTFNISTLKPELVADASKLRVNVLLIDTNTTHIANANKAWAETNSQTAIREVRGKSEKVSGETWYTLDGRKINGQWSMVNGQSLKKGLYVKNGKKIIK